MEIHEPRRHGFQQRAEDAHQHVHRTDMPAEEPDNGPEDPGTDAGGCEEDRQLADE
ncbi:hypothetical protein [Streptomyces sp. HUAS ZL42]|uniref:hypothetical protein n=1 Tax=Streptomyces sp. HUAS ZL42 TaxID=3231715 RepID=UPI00345EDFBD